MGITDEAVWKAEYTPAALKAFGTRVGEKLKCTVYYKGDEYHRKGRHRSRNWALNSAYCTNRSYGTTDARDKRGPGDAIRACDVMISGDVIEKVSRGVDEAVRAGRLPELAEWFGTFNSTVVVGWFEGHAASSDSSHLTHLHLGVWTQFVDSTAFYGRLFDAMMTYIDGGDMTPEESRKLDTIYKALLIGGDYTCGEVVPEPFRLNDSLKRKGNSFVEQLRYVRSVVPAVAGLDVGVTDEQLAALADTLLTGLGPDVAARLAAKLSLGFVPAAPPAQG